MNQKDIHNRIQAALKLLEQSSTSKDQFESVRTLIKGVNPRIDKALGICSKALSDVEKLQQGEIIDLTATNLPEQTEEQKKRKKSLLWLVKSWKDLKSEMERVKTELEKNEQSSSSDTASRILSSAKGPLGIITIAAVLIVGTMFVLNMNKNQPQTSTPAKSPKTKIQVITFDDKKIPMSELTTGIGPECLTGTTQQHHYHAKDHTSAKAIDGSMITDPGGCGYGKVNEIVVEEVEI